jgi:DNA end-binding protein Ku
MGDLLVMEQLHYQGELKSADDVPRPEVAVKDAELALARQLIEQGSVEEFKPENYRDTVRDRVLEAIQQKVDGQEITAEPTAPQTKIIDLMDALKASLAKRGAGPAEKQAAPASAARSDEKEPAAKPRKKAGGAR